MKLALWAFIVAAAASIGWHGPRIAGELAADHFAQGYCQQAEQSAEQGPALLWPGGTL